MASGVCYARSSAVRWLLIGLVMGMTSLASCATKTPTPEPVTISFAFPNQDSDYYQKLVQKFNQTYPHITVSLQPKRWDMLGGLGAGDADVFVSSQFAQSWLKEQNNILNLTPLIEQDSTFNTADFYPGALQLYTSEGKTWGVPGSVDIMIMFYNQDLFDQRSLPYPTIGWTWDDFLAATVALRDPNTNVFGYMPFYGPFDVLTFIYQHGGRIFDDLAYPTRTTFDDPLTVEALEWYVRLLYDYNVTPTPEQSGMMFGSADQMRRAIQLGQVGIWSELLSQRDQNWMRDMRVGMVPLPVDQQSTTLTLIHGYFVSSRTSHPDACWQWISFLSQQLPNRQVPVRKSMLQSSDYAQQAGNEVARVARASMENALLLSPELARYEEALELFTQALERISRRQATPLEAMTLAQQQSKFK